MRKLRMRMFHNDLSYNLEVRRPPTTNFFPMNENKDTPTVEKLKPCPFCGARADLVRKVGDHGYTSNRIDIKCSAGCCSQPGKDTEAWERGRGTFSIEDEVLPKLVVTWNGRKSSSWTNAEEERPGQYFPIIMVGENFLRNVYQIAGFIDDNGVWMQERPWEPVPNQAEIKWWRYSELPCIPKEES